MVSVAPAQPSAPEALAMGLRYGPNAGMALARSQYLANALQALQQNVQGNIRTKGALGSNLLADAILQWSKRGADQDATQAYQGDVQKRIGDLTTGTPLDPNYKPAGGGFVSPSTLPQSDPNAPRDPGMSVPPQATAAADPANVNPSPGSPYASLLQPGPNGAVNPTLLKLAQLTHGEAAGEGPQGEQAVAGVVMNRANKFGGPAALDAVMSAPHQFAGLNSRSQAMTADQLQPDIAALSSLLSGQSPNPAGSADHFYNPALASPSWGAGDGQMIGHHKFMTLGDAGPTPQGLAPQGASAPQAGRMPAGPAPGQPPAQSYQIASNGQPPPPPSPGAGPAPVPAPDASSPAGAGALPAGAPPQGVPHQMVTPEEWAVAKSLLQNPQTMDQGMALIQQLKLRAASPVEMKPGTYWGPDGQAHSVEQFQDQASAPNAYVQRSTLDNSIHAQANPGYGSLPAGTSMAPNGQISQVPIQQQQTFKIPNVNGVFVNGPDGRPVKVGDDQYGPEQLLKMRQDLLGSEPVKLYQQAADAYGSMVNAAKQGLGGMRAYALRDTFARAINPGAVARVGTIQAIQEAQGLPAGVKGFFMNLKGDGNVPPEIAQQILDVTHGFVASHYQGAQQLVQSNADYAKRHGIDPADVTVPLGDAPQPFRIPAQGAAAAPAQSPPPFGLSRTYSPQEIQAEIARRRQAGLMK